MRLYLSKDEAEIARGLLIDSILKRHVLGVDTNKHERLLNRIDDCLQNRSQDITERKK